MGTNRNLLLVSVANDMSGENNEEIACNDGFRMVANKCHLALGRLFSPRLIRPAALCAENSQFRSSTGTQKRFVLRPTSVREQIGCAPSLDFGANLVPNLAELGHTLKA